MIYLGKNPIGISNVRMPSLTAGPAPILNFTANTNMPLVSSKLTFSPIQEGTGDPSPSNVRPISGWSGVTACRGGKNLFNQEKYSVASGYPNSYNNYNYSDIVELKPNTMYIFKSNATQSISSGRYYAIFVNTGSDPESFDNKSYIYPVYNGNFSGAGVSNVFTTGETGVIRFGFPGGTNVAEMMTVDWQLEIGNVQTEYEPFAALDSYPVTFPAMGKNLFDEDSVTLGKIINKSLIITDAPYSAISSEIYVFGKTDITLMYNGTSPNTVYISELDSTKNIINRRSKSWGGNDTALTIALSSNTYYVYICVSSGDSSIIMTKELLSSYKLQLEEGSTPTTYEPFDNTVYGGYVDLATGVLTVEWERVSGTVDDTDTGRVSQVNVECRLPFKNQVPIAGAGASSNTAMCDIAKYWWEDTNVIPHFYMHIFNNVRSANVLLPLDIDRNTLITVISKLSTPLTYQLTPTEIQTLIGDNTIFSDTNGNLEVRYYNY